MRALYNASEDAQGEIAISATPAEWQEVINRILRTEYFVEDASDQLVHWLINQGVYE